jgi:predicted nucleic acid-binding protein
VSLTALDTGFFVRLLQGDGRAVDRWRALVEGEGEGVVSGLSLVELLRLSLKEAIGREDAGLLLDAIPAVCRGEGGRPREPLRVLARGGGVFLGRGQRGP